LGLMKVRI